MEKLKTLYEANVAFPKRKCKALLATMYKGFDSNGCVNVIELYEKDTDNARI